MISIIVSSINEEQNVAFRRNIEETIGVEYELLIHDNCQTGWGLCQLYNEYAARSRYDILCFFHEDIIFHTQDWGKILVSFFCGHPEAGVVGFAGSTIKTQHITGWGSYRRAKRMHMIQHFPDGRVRELFANPDSEEFSPVVLIDGLALITTKKVWSEHPFDEQLFQGFHLYDLDFTMQVAQHYTNYICHTICVEHFSNGSYTKEWFDESEKFHGKWKDRLPFSVRPYSKQFVRKCQSFDSYQAVRLRLTYTVEDMSLLSIIKQINRVDTFPYKFKLAKYIFRAGMERIGHRLHDTRKK